MTNYEKIKGMDILNMVDVLVPKKNYKNKADEEFCKLVCPYRNKNNGECPFNDDELPCLEWSDEAITLSWLLAEAKEDDKQQKQGQGL